MEDGTRQPDEKKEAAQRVGTLGLLSNRRSDLSVRKGLLLYKQLIRPMSDLEVHCPQPCPKACKPSVFELRLTHRQIHEDLGIPFYADHIEALTESFDPKFWGTPVTWKALVPTEGCLKSPG
jgi:hypothetical protein